MTRKNLSIGFAGLTHLGINSQVAAASKGFSTVGFHQDEKLVSRLQSAILPIYEPGLQELFEEQRILLIFSTRPEILNDCDLVYISVDVPTNDQDHSDLEVIKCIVDQVKPLLREDSLLVILCQVPPGFTRAVDFPSERLYYQVETLIFGRAVERATHPERVIVGTVDPDLPIHPKLETFLSAFQCPILPMRYESAELAKISINMCLVSSISVANTMAELCEKVGADWSEVVPALMLDRRIGENAYLKPGLGIAGGNLERDLFTMVRLAQEWGSNTKVVKAWIEDSSYRKKWAIRRIDEIEQSDLQIKTLGVLGLAYKENTASIKNSAAIALLDYLAKNKRDFQIKVYDPQVKQDSVPIKDVTFAPKALEACKNCEVVTVMTPWPEFGNLKPSALAANMNGNVLVDPYRVFNPRECILAGLRHLTLGRSIDV